MIWAFFFFKTWYSQNCWYSQLSVFICETRRGHVNMKSKSGIRQYRNDLSVLLTVCVNKTRTDKLFPCYSKCYNMEAWGCWTLCDVFTKSYHPLFFHFLPPETLLSFIVLNPPGPMLMSMCMCVSGRKTPLIRCHVVLEAVTCQGSSQYLSVTTCPLRVCGWLGTAHPNTHTCCSGMARTTERSAFKMTLIVTTTKYKHISEPQARKSDRRYISAINFVNLQLHK